MTIQLILFFALEIFTINCLSLTVDQITPEKGIVFVNNLGYPAIGTSVSIAGDVNGDGRDDILIGAPSANSSYGEVYVVYGTDKALGQIDFSLPLDPEVGFTLRGGLERGRLGISVSNAGDFNDDGIDDIIVSAPAANFSAGVVYIVYGSKTRKSDLYLGSELDPNDGFVIFGDYGESLGKDVDEAGDVNGDGINDVIIGASEYNIQQGKVYVIYGKKGFEQGNIYTESFESSQGFWLTGVLYSQFGKAVSGAGDLNGDGIGDIVIGSPNTRVGSAYIGVAYVIFGSQTALANKDFSTETLSPNEGFTLQGASRSSLGVSVSGIGDFNDDGFDDLVIGASKANNAIGQVHVIFGSNTSTFSNIDLTSGGEIDPSQGFTISAQPSLKPIGAAVNAAGDFNGDGIPDLLLGSNSMNSYLGGVLVLNGEKGGGDFSGVTVESPLDLSKWSYIGGKDLPSAIGYSVSSAGDFNGDGIDDVIFGSTDAYFGVGGAWMVFGSNGCPKYCKTCEGSKCLSCFLDFGIQGDACKKCEKDPNGLCPTEDKPEEENIDCPIGCKNCTSEQICQVCKEDYTLMNSQTCVSNSLSSQVNATSALFDGSSIVGNSLVVGSSMPANLGFASKMVRNTRYLNVPVSSTLQSAFQAWKTHSDFLSAPGSWNEKSSNGDESLPTVFEKYHVEHAFLINYWRTFIMTLIGVGLFLALRALNSYIFSKSTQKKKVWGSVIKSVSISASNFALAQIYSSLDDIIFFFALNAKGKGSSSPFENASLAFAIIFFLLLFALAGFHIYLIVRYQTLKRRTVVPKGQKPLDEFLRKYENIKIIYADFNDQNLFQQIFLLVNAFRSVLASLFMVTFFDSPLLQTIILTLMSIAILTYLYIFKPFREYISTYAQYFCEIILLIVNICMLILVCIDKSGAQSESSVERLSTAVVVLNMIMMIGSSIFILATIFLMFYGIYQERKVKIAPMKSPKTIAIVDKSKVYESNSPPISDSASSSQSGERPNSSSSGSSNSEGALLQQQEIQILDTSKAPLGLDTSSLQTERPLIQDPCVNDPLDAMINPSRLSKQHRRKPSIILGELELSINNLSH